MRKYLNILFAALLSISVMTGVANAQISIDPDTSGFIAETVSVYNNSASTVSKSDVVVWDIDASTGDDRFYINTTTTADTALVAGIVWPADIAAGARGSIAIWGIVQCTVDDDGADEAGPLCTSATAGEAQSCTDDSFSFGHATVDTVGGTGDCFVHTK